MKNVNTLIKTAALAALRVKLAEIDESDLQNTAIGKGATGGGIAGLGTGVYLARNQLADIGKFSAELKNAKGLGGTWNALKSISRPALKGLAISVPTYLAGTALGGYLGYKAYQRSKTKKS